MLLPHVIAETPDYVVINKPAGLLTHPTLAREAESVTSWLREQYPEVAAIGDDPQIRPGIVHRLDKETSGVMVVARTQTMFTHLKQQFQNRLTEKEYGALVYGRLPELHGIIDLPIARSTTGTMAASRDAHDDRTLRAAKTEWWVEQAFAATTLLRIKIYTGRTHQIRTHLKAIGHPVVGDPLYRAKLRWKKNLPPPPRLMLHARQLSFTDLAGTRQTFVAEVPIEFKNYFANLKKL